MKKQTGFTLIELMIASLIGLVVMAGMLNLFITTNKSVSLSDAMSQNQETGRFAMDYLTKFIRRAGYSENFEVNQPPLFMQNAFISCAPSTTEGDACSMNDLASIRGDRLGIPYYINAGETSSSCTGTDVVGPNSIVNVFWVSSDVAGNTDRELRCRTYSQDSASWLDNAVSIINNVESFQVQIGIASDETNRSAARYVSMDVVEDNELMNFVRSIRVAILTTSADSQAPDSAQTNKQIRTYGVLDSDYQIFDDGNLRNIFSNTIELPNMIETADL